MGEQAPKVRVAQSAVRLECCFRSVLQAHCTVLILPPCGPAQHKHAVEISLCDQACR